MRCNRPVTYLLILNCTQYKKDICTAHDKKERGHMTPLPTWEYVYRPMVGHASAQAMPNNLPSGKCGSHSDYLQ